MKIYLDTNLWNVMFDQRVEPSEFVRQLASENSRLVLSSHTIFELAKTFESHQEGAMTRGKELFLFASRCVDAGILCTKEIGDLLAEEATAFDSGTSKVIAFVDDEGYRILRAEVGRLASDGLSDVARKFIEHRNGSALRTRSNQISHMSSRPHAREQLTAVPSDQLEDWLQEATTRSGVAILTRNLVSVIEGLPVRIAAQTALGLLSSPGFPIARGIARAWLYYNWRCANRSSNPRDLIADMYHVLDAAYCDIYATGEEKQAQYAPLLLPAEIRIAIWPGGAPIDRWLMDMIVPQQEGTIKTASPARHSPYFGPANDPDFGSGSV